MKTSAVTAVIVALSIVGLAHGVEPKLPNNARETEALLNKRIPAGTSLAVAQREMESMGFSCVPGGNLGFGDLPSIGVFVYCNRQTRAIVAERWQVALVHSGGKVTEIHATYSLTGP